MLISKHIKLFTSAFLAAMALSSCLNLDETTDGAHGYLTIAGMDVNLQVDQLVATKADEATVNISGIAGYVAPELSSVTVVRKDDASKTYTWYAGETLSLPAGTYTLSATCGTNCFGAPCFEGKGEVAVTAGATATGTVIFTLANSVMKVTNAMPEHFEPSEGNCVTLLSDDSTLEPQSVTIAMDTYAFVPAGKLLKVNVQGKNTAGGNQKPFECPLNKATEKAKAYNVTLSANGVTLPEISLSSEQVAWGDRIFITTPATGEILSSVSGTVIYEAIPAASTDWTASNESVGNVITGLTPGSEYKVRARIGGLVSDEVILTPAVTGIAAAATHTKTEDYLDGTDVNTTFTSPHQIVTESIASWSYQLKNSSGTVLREYSDEDGTITSDGSSLTGTTDWPYLPQGTYTLVATATLDDDSTVSSTLNVAVAKPSFGVTASAETSYSYYLNDGASVANAKAAETIYEISSNIGVSENILDNTNYTKPSVTYSVGGKSASGTYGSSNNHKLGSEISGLSWGSHNLIATVKFDDVEVASAPCVCVITGLPYSYNFVNGSLDQYRSDGWTTNEKLRVSSEDLSGRAKTLVLQHYRKVITTSNEKGFVVSPKFNIPNTVDVQTKIVRSSYRSSGNTKRTGYVGPVASNTSSNTTAVTYITEGGTSTKGEIYGTDEWLDSFEMLTDTPYISIDCDAWSSGSGGVYYFLHEAHFRYSEQ